MPKRFQFRLQPLLESYDRKIRKAKQFLAQKIAEKELADKQVELCQAGVEKGRQLQANAEQYLAELQAKALNQRGDWTPTLASARFQVERWKFAIADVTKKLNIARNTAQINADEVEQANLAYTSLLRFQKQIETLRDKELLEFRREQEMKEMAELNEVGSALHYLNQFVENEEQLDG